MRKVAIVMGSDSDLPIMQKAVDMLRKLEIEFEVRVTRSNSGVKFTTEEVMENLAADVYAVEKKEVEGKPKKAAKIAGLNEFLRIYYARVMEAYRQIPAKT